MDEINKTNKDSTKGIEIPEICKDCGGKCCKTYPGPATPEDFGAPNRELMRINLLQTLKTGFWVIDWINQDEELYFLRPAVKGFEGSLFDHTYSGECTFLSPAGCKLTFNERPESCRMLVPKPKEATEKCDPQGYTRMYVAKLWKEYANLLLDVAISIENIENIDEKF